MLMAFMTTWASSCGAFLSCRLTSTPNLLAVSKFWDPMVREQRRLVRSQACATNDLGAGSVAFSVVLNWFLGRRIG